MDPFDDVAAFLDLENSITDSAGHFTYWEILINRNYSISKVTMAHEFGDVIGLKDLYSTSNIDKLMYCNEIRTSSSPQKADKNGAKVITGVHSSHTWSSYKYYDSVKGANRHKRECM